ncbi:hypothetical protein KIPB_015747, partial [Kipferlia bialata]
CSPPSTTLWSGSEYKTPDVASTGPTLMDAGCAGQGYPPFLCSVSMTKEGVIDLWHRYVSVVAPKGATSRVSAIKEDPVAVAGVSLIASLTKNLQCRTHMRESVEQVHGIIASMKRVRNNLLLPPSSDKVLVHAIKRLNGSDLTSRYGSKPEALSVAEMRQILRR